jgi:predicted nucleic acid-binding protein
MPESTRVVVVNTTPLVALSLVGQIDLLRLLYAQVLIPPAVQAEILAGGPAGIGVADLRRADWIRVAELRDPRRVDLLLTDLDRGEAEVIVLAQETNADLVIIDERLARWHAARLGLILTGTLGVLLRAKSQGHITVVKPLLEQLREGGIWLSEQVVAEVLRLAQEA